MVKNRAERGQFVALSASEDRAGLSLAASAARIRNERQGAARR